MGHGARRDDEGGSVTLVASPCSVPTPNAVHPTHGPAEATTRLASSPRAPLSSSRRTPGPMGTMSFAWMRAAARPRPPLTAPPSRRPTYRAYRARPHLPLSSPRRRRSIPADAAHPSRPSALMDPRLRGDDDQSGAADARHAGGAPTAPYSSSRRTPGPMDAMPPGMRAVARPQPWRPAGAGMTNESA